MRRPTAMFVAALWLGAARVVGAQPDAGDGLDAPGAVSALSEGIDAGGAPAQATELEDASIAGQPADDGPAVQVLGDGELKLYVVDHGSTWSMHVQGLLTDDLVRLWNQVGGPQVVAKTVLDRPYNLSVHKLPPERILERLLDGFDYTLHYDAAGRLERVRVYSLDPSSASTFKTPRLVESLGRWREVEKAAPSAGDAAAPPEQAAPPSAP